MFNGHVNGGEAKIPKEWEAHPQSTLHRAQQPAEMLREHESTNILAISHNHGNHGSRTTSGFSRAGEASWMKT